MTSGRPRTAAGVGLSWRSLGAGPRTPCSRGGVRPRGPTWSSRSRNWTATCASALPGGSSSGPAIALDLVLTTGQLSSTAIRSAAVPGGISLTGRLTAAPPTAADATCGSGLRRAGARLWCDSTSEGSTAQERGRRQLDTREFAFREPRLSLLRFRRSRHSSTGQTSDPPACCRTNIRLPGGDPDTPTDRQLRPLQNPPLANWRPTAHHGRHVAAAQCASSSAGGVRPRTGGPARAAIGAHCSAGVG